MSINLHGWIVLLSCATALAQNPTYTPGMTVEVKRYGDWVPGRVVRHDASGVLVMLPLADGRYDEATCFRSYYAPADVRLPGTAVAPPPDTGELYQPGREVEIKYGVNWLRGKIEKVEGDRVFVSWDGYHESQNCWVPRDHVRPRGGATAPQPTPQPTTNPTQGVLDGVQLWTQVTPSGTRIIRYLFRPDGRFMSGHAFAGGERRSYEEAARTFPDSTGTFRIEGMTLTLAFNSTTTQSKELVSTPEGLRIKGWQRGIPFPAGHRLEATYEVQGGLAIAGATGDQAQRWVFRGNGTFEVHEGRGVTTGQGAAHATRTEQLLWQGSYELARHTLTLRFAQGGQQEYTIFLSGEQPSAAPRMVFVDLGVFKRQE